MRMTRLIDMHVSSKLTSSTVLSTLKIIRAKGRAKLLLFYLFILQISRKHLRLRIENHIAQACFGVISPAVTVVFYHKQWNQPPSSAQQRKAEGSFELKIVRSGASAL